MQIIVEIPSNLPDAAQCTPQQFLQEAKLGMARNEEIVVWYGGITCWNDQVTILK